MKSKILLIWSFLLSLMITGCEKYQYNVDQTDNQNKVDTVHLLKMDIYITFEKYVVLYDQDDYLIKAPLSYFLQDLYFITGLSYPKYLAVSDSIIHDAYKSNELLMSKYFNSHDHKYVLAHFLDNGLCYIRDKKNKITVMELIKETWGYNCGALCGAGGRKFYIQGKLFLEVTDWISKK